MRFDKPSTDMSKECLGREMKEHGVMRWLPWALLGIFTFAVFSFKTWSYPLTDYAETLCSGVGRELLNHRDWWTLYWDGEPWFTLAPMSAWIQATFFKLFGVSEFTARLHPIVFGTGLVLLTAAFGSMLFNRRTGIIAGLVLVSSPFFFVIARVAIMDMPFAFFITLAIYLFVRSIKTGNKWLYPAFWFAAGLATLSKGLWGVVLACMICFLYMITGSERRRLLDYRLYVSAIAWAAVVAPWLLINYQRWGMEFLEPVIAINTYKRITMVVWNHQGPWYYYLPVIIGGMLPWSLIGIKAWFKKNGDSGRLLLFWILPAFLIHSIAQTKLSNYMLPLIPAIALMTAVYFNDLKRTRSHGVFMIVFAIGMGATLLYGKRFMPENMNINVPLLAVWISIAYLISGIALIKLKKWATPAAAVCMVAALSIFPIIIPSVADNFSSKNIALEARELAGENAVVTLDGVVDEYGRQGMPGVPRVSGVYFYAQRPFIDAKDIADLKRVIYENPHSALVLPADMMDELSQQGIEVQIVSTEEPWTLAKPLISSGNRD